mmetsp:Transcript_3314/g.7796  ORF Transcript_3314/g.7796 Transcript_3314/m.7796 type:complete len:631 (-) Transcript_3314:258-2150(-)
MARHGSHGESWRVMSALLLAVIASSLTSSLAFLTLSSLPLQHRGAPLLCEQKRIDFLPRYTRAEFQQDPRSTSMLLRKNKEGHKIERKWGKGHRTSLDAETAAAGTLTIASSKSTKLPGMDRVLFIETGFGADQHGQNITKAAVRACRNAIEFNSIPSIAALLPGGYADMVLRVSLSLPLRYAGKLDLEQVRKVFPYGRVIFNLQEGGCRMSSGIALEKMGDVGDAMLMVAAHVAVGSAAPESEDDAGGGGGGVVETGPEPETHSYAELVEYVREARAKSCAKQVWIAVVGAPGSGKSTVAQRLLSKLTEEGVKSVVVPMDGYHYYRKELDLMPNPTLFHARRGAHWTFNASKLVDDLARAKEKGEGVFPAFDHADADPSERAVTLSPDVQVVVVEGLYLALREVEPWRQLQRLFDETWFVEGEEQVLRERVIRRNAEAWQLPLPATAARVDANDIPNMRLVQACAVFADRRLRLPSDFPEDAQPEYTPAAEAGLSPVHGVTKMKGMKQALFIEAGFGADQVGLDATKAAARACRNAIEFNSIPAIRELMAEGYSDMLIRVTVCVPGQFIAQVDPEALRPLFPYGSLQLSLQEGGALFLSGQRTLHGGSEALDWMLVAIAHVVVGVKDDT